MGQQRRGKPSGGRDVTVSKALSLLLRHAAEKEGLKLDSQGYANVADVVRYTLISSLLPPTLVQHTRNNRSTSLNLNLTLATARLAQT